MKGHPTPVAIAREVTPTQQGVAQEAPDGAMTFAGNGMRSVAIEAAEVQASMQPWFRLECYQLSRGTRLAQVDLLDLGGRHIVRESQYAAIHKLGATGENQCTVSSCTPMPGSRLSEFSSDAAAAVFFLPRNTEFDIHVPAGACTTYVSFDQDEFVRGARALAPELWERPPAQLDMFTGVPQTAFLDAVAQIERAAASGHSLDPSVLRDLTLQLVLMSTVGSTSGNALPHARDRARAFDVCRKARALIADSLAAGFVPTIPEICTAVNVSERTLQYAFRRYVGMTPLAYLRVCRLNRVRSELLALGAETTVTTVALRYGFLHLGRFASDYKRLFGESPSRELARLV